MSSLPEARPDVAALFQRHGAAVYRRARRLLGTHHDAEEATQEIFIRVMGGIDRFEARSNVTTWLYQVTTNYCLNQIRDRKRHRELLATQAEPSELHAGAPPAADQLAELRELLMEAEDDQAQAALYVFVDGMSHDEAAELMNVSRRTVGNLLTRFKRWAEERTSGGSALPELAPEGSKEAEDIRD